MDQIDSSDPRARASALLGLRLTQAAGATVGEPPTIEEFTALYEGSLDATRRAQVLGYLAQDQQLYQRWMNVVSAQATLDANLHMDASAQSQTARQAATQASGEATSVVGRVAGWLREHIAVPAGVGSFAAAALVVVLIIPGQEEAAAPGTVDQLYDEYAGQWQAPPSTLPGRTVRGATAPVTASAEQQALYLGLRAGLDQLGGDFPDNWLTEMPLDDALQELEPAVRDALVASGRLATLARFKCQLNGSEAFFLQADQTLAALQPVLKQHPSRVTRNLVAAIDQPVDAFTRSCDFAVVAVAMLASRE